MSSYKWIVSASLLLIVGLIVLGLTRWSGTKPDGGYLVVNFYSTPSKVFAPEGELVLTLPGVYFTPISGGFAYLNSNGMSLVNSKLEVIWNKPDLNAHHVVSLDEKENVFFPSHRLMKKDGKILWINLIIGLDREGNEIFSWDEEKHHSEMHREMEFPDEPEEVTPDDRSYTHKHLNINGVTVIEENALSATNSNFRKGNLLITEERRHLFILDRETGSISFNLNMGELLGAEGIHTARILKNGNILLFNNITNHKGTVGVSRIVEFDPLEREIVWQYSTPPPTDFYNMRYAGVFITDAGTMLISDARKGRVFEINADKEIIWEWINPEKTPEGQGQPLFHAKKFRAEVVEPFIN